MDLTITNYPIPVVVAEVGATHAGSIERAKSLIRLAKLAGADYVKFQKRNPIESVPKEWHNRPHPNSSFSYGDTYLEHRLALELSIDQHGKLKEFCESIDIGYACSVWDLTSVREIIGLSPDFIKIPSAFNSDFDLLEVLFKEYNGDVHISLGMSTDEEKKNLYDFISSSLVGDRVVLYHCTSEYPCLFEHLYLLEIRNLHGLPAKSLGFSNHGYGIAADVAAYALGATWIERHFIDDRTFRHTDASFSLEPSGLCRLVRDLKNIRKSLLYKHELSAQELEQKDKLRN